MGPLEDFFGKSESFFTAIKSDRFYSILPKARESRLVESMLDVVKAPSLFKTLDILAKSFKGLRGMVGSLEDVIDGDVPLGEVYELAASFRGRIDSFVETLDAALRRAQEVRAGQEENGVVLATFFKAKGLQWHTVIITSCNQGIIPHKRAPVDDERKLFHVALTRASSNLIVSFLKRSCKTKVAPSVFLAEAGLHG
jgi:DNA helicase-2/ATP-dependent DNA helicase PcrA